MDSSAGGLAGSGIGIGAGRAPRALRRRARWLAAALGLGLLLPGAAAGESPPRRALPSELAARVDGWIEKERPELIELYRALHRSPELSLAEEQTAARAARRLKAAGFEVTTGVGGHGVVGLLRNGAGPTLLVRGDTDGLPVTEETGLPWASRVKIENAGGGTVGTMHACGHDVHVTTVLGTAALLESLRDAWRGTVVVIAQPAEEIGRGALMMIEDGLFERIPRPDHGISLHVEDSLESGRVGLTAGYAAANVDSVDITVFGRGGHGARPHRGVDPIVAAAHLVTSLQSIVSRRIEPGVPAVVTVGSIHGGTKHNVIPDEVHLQLTVRSYAEPVRNRLLRSIEEMAGATCAAFECPRPPQIRIKPDATPAMYNDPELVAHAERLFVEFLGEEGVARMAPSMGGEDFGRYTRVGGFPTLQYRLGSVAPERMAASREPGGPPLPSLHSSQYAPDEAATLETGVATLSRLALSLLGDP